MQLQLEQDSGKSLHDPSEEKSLIDLNRFASRVLGLETFYTLDLEAAMS